MIGKVQSVFISGQLKVIPLFHYSVIPLFHYSVFRILLTPASGRQRPSYQELFVILLSKRVCARGCLCMQLLFVLEALCLTVLYHKYIQLHFWMNYRLSVSISNHMGCADGGHGSCIDYMPTEKGLETCNFFPVQKHVTVMWSIIYGS